MTTQPLFPGTPPSPAVMDRLVAKIPIPPEIQAALERHSPVVINLSGGKDSDAMLYSLEYLLRTRFNYPVYPDPGAAVHLLHCHLGRNEWPQTLAHVQSRARATFGESALHILRREQGDLLAQWQERHVRRPEVAPWSDARNRYCTSDQKASPASKFCRHTWPANATVICAIGLRAEESPARARKPVCRLREAASAPTRNRFVYDWLPVFHFTQADVWQAIGYSLEELAAIREHVARAKAAGADPLAVIRDIGFRAHAAYALQATRLSCALCTLASRGDLLIGAEYNPDHYRDLVDLEIASGFSFRPGLWIADLRSDLLTAQQRRDVAAIQARRQTPEPSPRVCRTADPIVQLSLF